MTVRDPEQCTSTVWGQVPNFKITGIRNQNIVIIVSCPAQSIITYINFAASLQQFHLIHVSKLPENVNRLSNRNFRSMERHSLRHNFRHPLLDEVNVICLQTGTVALVNAAEEAFGYRPAHDHLAIWENI